MHQDVLHNRQTEIMAICGYISEQGKRHNIATPYNDALLAEILAKKKRGINPRF
jgi:2-dehydropantoate 2-reductase